MTIRVKSIKSQHESVKLVSSKLHKDFVSLEDIQAKFSSMKRHQRVSTIERSSALYEQSVIPEEATSTTVKKQGCCLCLCLGSRKQKTKRSEKYAIPDAGNGTSEALPTVVTYQPNKQLHGSQVLTMECIKNGNNGLRSHDDSLENLRLASNSLQETSNELYALLSDTGSSAHAKLLRYATYSLYI